MPEIVLGHVVREIESQGFSISESFYPAGTTFPDHTHRQAFFYLVLSGACVEKYDGEEQIQRPLSLVFHAPSQTHQTRWPNGGRCLSLGFTPGRWHDMQDWAADMPSFGRFRSATPCLIARRLYEEFRSTESMSAPMIERLVAEIISTIRPSGGSIRPKYGILSEAVRYIDERYMEEWSLCGIAKRVSCDPSYLARLFKLEFSMTVGEYIRKRRIDCACEEMLVGDMPLGEIALKAGFYDQSHFWRAFRLVTGLSPSAYRRNHTTSR